MDWGMSNRLSNIIKPGTGRTVMLAVDHGYFLGPTSGLEQPGKTVKPLLEYADTLMLLSHKGQGSGSAEGTRH